MIGQLLNAPPDGQAEAVRQGRKAASCRRDPTSMPDGDPSVVGEHQMPIGGMFGDTPPAACEFCGGGGCLPPPWTAKTRSR